MMIYSVWRIADDGSSFYASGWKSHQKVEGQKWKLLYQEAIDRIRENHLVGEQKTGDLAGTRENFYEQLKRYMKNG